MNVRPTSCIARPTLLIVRPNLLNVRPTLLIVRPTLLIVSPTLLIVSSTLLQGRPVRALCDAYMHHGKSRGKRNRHKVCKKTREFFENRGEICKSREEIIIFAK